MLADIQRNLIDCLIGFHKLACLAKFPFEVSLLAIRERLGNFLEMPVDCFLVYVLQCMSALIQQLYNSTILLRLLDRVRIDHTSEFFSSVLLFFKERRTRHSEETCIGEH